MGGFCYREYCPDSKWANKLYGNGASAPGAGRARTADQTDLRNPSPSRPGPV